MAELPRSICNQTARGRRSRLQVGSLEEEVSDEMGNAFCILQDDGWLMGVKEEDISVKGVFPENFTQKV